MNFLQNLGNRIKQLRELKGLTQEQLAELCDTTPQYISALERGKKNATLAVLERIALGLEVEPFLILVFSEKSDRFSKSILKKVIDHLPDKEAEKYFRILKVLLDSA